MAVRVIYRDPKAVREVTCSECAARLAYVPADETRGTRDVMGRDTEVVWWVECPDCKAHVTTRRES